MKASEKFEARLKELNLWDEWNSVGSCGRVGKFGEEGEVNLLVHEGRGDKYSEIWYAPFDELRDKDEKFVSRCWDLVRETEDGEFARDLALWLMKKTNKDCPLHPSDAYFLATTSEHYHDFEDDDDEEERKEREYQTFIEQTQDLCVWMEYSLGIMRKKLIEAINVELDRGHNVGHDFRIEDDYSYFRDFYMDNVSYQEVVRENGLLALDCVTMSGPSTDKLKETERFSLPLTFLSEQDLLKIYEQMK